MNTNQQNYLQITFIIRHTSISVFICRKDDKLEIDLHVTLNDIIAYHTLFGMQNEFPSFKRHV
jgi:thiamine phosphate synthase YjbQ (UPF0047 family)